MAEAILTILASIGGSAVILIGLMTWLGKIWQDALYLRLTARQNKEIEEIKNIYNIELEHIRAEITEKRDVLNSASNALSGGYIASHPHIVESINEIWRSILEVDSLSSSYIFVHNILLKEEVEELHNKPLKGYSPPLDEKIDTKYINILHRAEAKRPFVGEKIWTLFTVYNVFSIRICMKMQETNKKKGLIYSWDKDMDGKPDKASYNTLTLVFTEKELEKFYSYQFGAPKNILDAIKNKILSEMNSLIFGRELITLSIDEQKKISESIRSINTP